MSVNIPQRAEIIIHNIFQTIEDRNEIFCEVNGVKYRIIENSDTVRKTDRAPRAAVCISLYSDGLDCKNALFEKGRNSVNGKNTVAVNLYSDGFDIENSSSKKGRKSVNGKNTVVVNYLVSKL